MWGYGLWASLSLYPTYGTVLFGGGTAVLFAAIKNGDLHGRVANASRALGDTSYALYLTHPVVLALLFETGWAARIATALSPEGLAAAYCGGALLLGMAFHLAIERGVLRWRPRSGGAVAAANGSAS